VLRNPGAGFGLAYAGDQRLVATALGVAAVVYFYVFFRHMPRCGRTSVLGLGCMMGGATGNLADRVGSPVGVVDFIHVDAGAFAPYVFNVADVAIVTGGLLICWALATREIEQAPSRLSAARQR
jgi:signal peptidase II